MSSRRFIRRLKHKLTDLIVNRYALLFPDQTTVRLMQILGSSTLVIGSVRQHGRPMTIVLWRGAMLRSENFRLAYVDGKPVLSNDVRMAIALEDDDRTRDILIDQHYDEVFSERGYNVRWIPARWLSQPAKVKADVSRFIYG